MRILFSRLGAAVLAAALVPAVATASTITSKDIVVFGDSLSDTRWAHELSGGSIPPSPPYAEKRFANGPIWIDRVGKTMINSGGSVQNFAVGGSPQFPGIPAQIAAFGLTGEVRPDMAAVMFGGHNDIEWIAFNRPRGSLGRRAADRAARLAAQSVGTSARALAETRGIEKFVLVNTVDVGQLPLYANRPTRAGYATRAASIYNQTLERVALGLASDGYEVAMVDVAALFRNVMANPLAYGFTNVTDPCLSPKNVPCADPDSYLFWDQRHITSAAHWHLAMLFSEHLQPPNMRAMSQVQMASAPVPAPLALLLAGVGALALTSHRCRA